MLLHVLRRYIRRFLFVIMLVTSGSYILLHLFGADAPQSVYDSYLHYKMDIGLGLSIVDNDTNITRQYRYTEPGENCVPKKSDSRLREKLLTLFTTFDMRKHKPYHIFAHKMTIRNWAKFRPDVQPVLFTEHGTNPMFKWARRIGWDVLPVPKASPMGAPHIKPMYQKVFDTYSSTFYAYANGDILFDRSLLNTLKKIRSLLPRLSYNVMLVGRRHNFRMDLKQTASMYDIKHLNELKLNARLFNADAEDYFIFTRDCSTFNWTNVTDVVVGRPAYDNYLVGMARMMRVNVIDATNTLLALHLSTPNVTYEGGRNKDASFNRRLIGRFRWAMGMTVGLKLRTTHDKVTHEVKLIGRLFNTTNYIRW